jgi:hypothetical protein
MSTPLIKKPFLTSFFSIIISVFAVAFIANATSTISTNIHTDGTLSSGLLGTASGSLSLKGLTSGIVSIVPGDTAGTWTLTLPTTDGNDGEVLTTNGSGVTSWEAAAGGVQSVTGTLVDTTDPENPEVDLPYKVYTAYFMDLGLTPGVGNLVQLENTISDTPPTLTWDSTEEVFVFTFTDLDFDLTTKKIAIPTQSFFVTSDDTYVSINKSGVASNKIYVNLFMDQVLINPEDGFDASGSAPVIEIRVYP